MPENLGIYQAPGRSDSHIGFKSRYDHCLPLHFVTNRLPLIASCPPKVLSFDIPSLMSLRSMSVIIHNGSHSTTPLPMRWHTLSWLHETLRAVSHTSYIEIFKLVVGDQTVDDSARGDDLNLWNGMDLALASRAFPHLRSVSVTFDTQRENPRDLSSFLNKRMPRLVSKGMVSIEWIFYPPPELVPA